jgi:tetratricopeptide (TPR) repeat protein
MKITSSAIVVPVIVLLSGCASFQAATDVQYGREAFIIGHDKVAESYFQKAARIDPNYVKYGELPEGVWSYLGRAEYANGELTQARKSLERALALNKDDNMAKLYLGLTLARAGDRQQGLADIKRGLKGTYDWLEYITQAFRYSFGQYWDPTGEIRSGIKSTLAMTSSKDLDWPKLIASAEWVGRKVEEEIDLAQRDESESMSREGGGGEHEP